MLLFFRSPEIIVRIPVQTWRCQSCQAGAVRSTSECRKWRKHARQASTVLWFTQKTIVFVEVIRSTLEVYVIRVFLIMP